MAMNDATGSGCYTGVPNQDMEVNHAARTVSVLTTIKCNYCGSRRRIEYVQEDGTLTCPSQQCGCGASFDAQHVHGLNYYENA